MFSSSARTLAFVVTTAAVAMLGVVWTQEVVSGMERAPRIIDEFSTKTMLEDGELRAAAPECKGQLGWVYYNGYCYMFTSYHLDFLAAEEACNVVGGYLADVKDQAENDFIKKVLTAINPRDGTDYWIGGLDDDNDKGVQWITGLEMAFTDYVNGEPKGKPYLHMNFDSSFAWDTKDDATDKDNGFVCKKKQA